MRRSILLMPVFALLAVVVVGILVVVPASPETGSARAADSSAKTASIRVAVVGDSLSAGRSRFLGNGLDDETWMTYADGGRLEYVGGWARFGATPDEMAEAVQPIKSVDVLVILAGTNAVRTGKTMGQERAAYERIVRVIRPKRVLVSSLPPYRAHAAAALAYSEALREFTGERGWSWIDPWVPARDGDDWAPGFSTDGTHPAGPEQYRTLGESFRRLILEGKMSDVHARR